MNINKSIMNYYELTKSSYENSTNQYHLRIVNHIINACDALKIKKLEKVDINVGYKIITYLKNNTSNGNNSIKKIINYLRKVMQHYRITTSIVDLPHLPSDTKPFERFYHDDLKLIIDYVKNLNSSKNSLVYKTLLFLLLDSGLRISEALSIKIKEIDFRNRMISVYSGKTRKHRYAPFSDFSYNFLIQLVQIQSDRIYLFHNFIKDRLINKNDIKLFYRRLKSKLKIERIHTHRFRKTFASILIENGLNIDDLQKLFDHSRIETTIKYVQHDEKRALKEYRLYNDWGV
ncbi:Tyrosine recombinase XerC [Acholeplasma oculi]|nr:tyrosine-type recombinase/integrase [Acholeplasma oculi]SKC34602.1 integrase/recombinase XerC [Acholeplasma oculi]SKC45738.1 integrase/recombinase XerC [Acholeplasma oculi]SUT89407.1 Tyrosine recombinase XerC [Acholeplasma oculi]